VLQLKTKNQNDRQSAEIAHEAYKQQVREFQQTQKKFEEGMKAVLAQFQELDTKRLAKMKELWTDFVKISEQTSKLYVDAVPPMKEAVAAMDAPKDVQGFIDNSRTNEKPESPAQYEPYVSDARIICHCFISISEAYTEVNCAFSQTTERR
jgi:hypothetical protein